MKNKKCPECKHQKFILDEIKDELYCRNCGLVLRAPYAPGLYYPGFLYSESSKIIIKYLSTKTFIVEWNI